MRQLTQLLLLLIASFSVGVARAQDGLDDDPPETRDVSDFRLSKGLALDGYDPVAYFRDGGGKPAKGSKDITVTHRGVTYRFTKKEHRALIEKDPAKYEPMYGGWCAFTMADKGKKVAPKPKNYLIEGGLLYLFQKRFFANGRSAWKKKGAKLMKPLADANWTKFLDATKREKDEKKKEKGAGKYGGLRAWLG